MLQRAPCACEMDFSLKVIFMFGSRLSISQVRKALAYLRLLADDSSVKIFYGYIVCDFTLTDIMFAV